MAGQRGGFSVDAIKEFIVVSNSFSAEYGQSSGAIVSVVTRSGTNQMNGRGFYYHRDDSWDASTAASKLVTPTPPKSKLEQKIVGGFFGGPIRQNRAFYFASLEYTKRVTENLVTAPTVGTFLPNDPIAFEQPTTNPQFLGKVDLTLSAANTLAVKYRRDSDKQIAIGIGGTASRERGQDRDRTDQDVALQDSWVLGSRMVNEFRMQVARRYFNWDVTPYCPNCPTVNRPGLGLGKASNMPQGRTEDRIQIANTFNWLVPDLGGSHSFKAGVDASFIDLFSEFHNNLDGTFTFTTSTAFNPAVASTYPTQFTGNIGDPIVNLNNNIYAAFVQDQWRPADRLTVNLGLRWDFEDVVGIDHDKNNFAPRLGLVWDLNGSGRTVLRANAGIYYDQIFLNIPLNAENAKKFVQTLITNPGYPDPNGPNPNRTTGPITPIPSSTQFAPDNRTPYTQQLTAGIQKQLGNAFSISADLVGARGYGLLRSSDANYPNLDDPARARPNPSSSASPSSRPRATPGIPGCRWESKSACRNAIPTRWPTRCRRPSGTRKTSTSSRSTTATTTWSAGRPSTTPPPRVGRIQRAVAVGHSGGHAHRGPVEAAVQRHHRRRRQPRYADQRSAGRRRPQRRSRRQSVPGRSAGDQGRSAWAGCSSN